ncbi:MAG: zf-TFIIB domain-containing protein [Meiothermus sp.]|uniref:TFIIB-type zinc ribbon-containing protein n=1 Tax=Meiothermus sp. TaxID=1955249 RepID=UPI0025E3D255|nr:zf-TFIIB domain-containing protein [Meiothermus sp.]MCS7058509.1 zf-TFIIB domain-containing protein [Meiothermus sp.]MCS7195108.1 zf-TFIIB domain-containing protein [Meiothermus sp.]MCX7740260.1 zf-TFIIB domain-containing protein [Meiothermus sp.]MDW8091040.1 zf-TFIIB domain-containing protein [Meiothermus sp.]MDW8480929.1 zf-TFIIB domain-containing protein [Meiothermus sp.]
MPLLVCPNCESGMNEVVRNGVHIDVCPKCRGVWLDGGELEKLLGQVRRYEEEYEAELDSYRRYAPPSVSHRNPYDTDDDEYHRRKRKSKLSRLFDLFD